MLSRFVHSLIHATTDYVIRRFQAFLAGMFFFTLMAAGFAAQLILKAL